MAVDVDWQEKCRQFVANEVYLCQSMLVDAMLQKGVFNFEDIENLYKSKEELIDEGYSEEDIEKGNADDMKEIYEWWVVSDWLERKLKERGEPILTNDYGSWWGRCSTGQAIFLDYVIEEIVKGLYPL